MKAGLIGLLVVMLAAVGYADQDVIVNVDVNVNNGNMAAPQTPLPPPMCPPRSQVLLDRVFSFRGGMPIDIPLPGIEELWLRLILWDGSFALCGKVMRPCDGDPNMNDEIVNAKQLAMDRPGLPSALCRWTYTAVDGAEIAVSLVLDRVTLSQSHTPGGLIRMHMEPALRVRIVRR